jgi:hypothetical protein
MKMIKLLTASMLAMLALNVASAQTEIRFTGSTAFRKATVNSIENILQAGYVWGSTTGTGAGANQQVFVGTTKTTNVQVIIKCSWSGSAGGVQSLAAGIAAGQPFIIDPVVTSYSTPAATVGGIALSTITATPNGANIPSGDITESHIPDVALSDAFASTTPFTGAGFAPLTDTVVGIVPFEFVKSAYTPDGTLGSAVPGGYPGVANISGVQAQELLGGGLALNQFTGNPSDQAIFVQTIGRDHDSGTRIATIYDSQYGNYSSPVLQNIANGQTVGATQFASQSAGSGVISTLAPWPVETVLGENRAAGNEGFFSGSNVATTLTRPVDVTQGNYLISYVGMSDASSVNPGTGVSGSDGAGNPFTYAPSQNALTLDGYYPGTAAHPFAPPYTNLEQGIYTFWGYEHYLYLSSLGAGNLKTVANQVATQLTTEANFGGFGDLLSNMNASRLTDGAAVTSP